MAKLLYDPPTHPSNDLVKQNNITQFIQPFLRKEAYL